MKKKLAIITAGIIVIVAGAAALAVFKLNDIVSGLRPQIEKQASASLGAPVQLGDISVSIFPSLELSVSQASILNQETGTSVLSVGALNASVALRPLLGKRLEISNLEISRPKITLIKDANGTRVQGLPPTPQQSPPQKNSPPLASSPAAQPIDISVSRITIIDGEITLRDTLTSVVTPIRSVNLDAGIALQGKEISIPNLQLSFAAAQLPPLTFTGSSVTFGKDTGKLSIQSFDIASDLGNLHADGTLDTTSMRGTFTVTSKGIDLKKVGSTLKSSVPNLTQMNLSGSVTTNLSVSLNGSQQPIVQGPITVRDGNVDLPSGQKVRALNGEFALQGPPDDLTIKTAGLKLLLQDLPLLVTTTARVSSATVNVNTLSIKGLGGEANLPATLQRTGSKSFSIQPNLTTLSITDLLKVSQPGLAQSISGTIAAAKGNFSGNLSGDAARSLSGPGTVTVRDLVLKGVNLGNLILMKVSGIPLLEGTLRANIAPEHQKYFNDPDTRVRELTADYAFNNGTVNLRTLTATSDAFTLESSGSMSLGGDLNLSSTFILNPEISASLAKRSKTVTAMLNSKKMLAIPVVIQGKSPKLIVLPDISKLLQGTAGKILEEKAGALLDRALGGKKGPNGKKPPLGGILGF